MYRNGKFVSLPQWLSPMFSARAVVEEDVH
jgi:hypothetical protein